MWCLNNMKTLKTKRINQNAFSKNINYSEQLINM